MTRTPPRWAIRSLRTGKITLRAIPSKAVANAVCAPNCKVIIDPRSIQR